MVRSLGVLLDSSLSLSPYVSSVARACFYHLRRIRQIRHSLDRYSLKTIVQALVLSRLDYCNAVLAGLPAATLRLYTSVLHSAARLVAHASRRDHISPILRQLSWLPISSRIIFKLCLIIYKIFNNRLPIYLLDSLTLCSDCPGRQRLRSSSRRDLTVPRTHRSFSNRAFSIAGPIAWNATPTSIRESPTLTELKLKLKTHLLLQ